MIQSIAFFVYPVADLKRARDFYERILGLKVETDFGGEWIEFTAGGATFAITAMDATHKPGVKGGVIAFEVDDLEQTIAHLKSNNVQFAQENGESPVCRFSVALDPDGNEVIVHRRKT